MKIITNKAEALKLLESEPGKNFPTTASALQETKIDGGLARRLVDAALAVWREGGYCIAIPEKKP